MKTGGRARPGLNLTLDTGALIAAERGDERIDALLACTMMAKAGVAIPAPVVAQAWQHHSRQVVLARLLAQSLVEVVPLDDVMARAAGILCGLTGTQDIVDATVVLCAQERGNTLIVTSDPEDLVRLDPHARIVTI